MTLEDAIKSIREKMELSAYGFSFRTYTNKSNKRKIQITLRKNKGVFLSAKPIYDFLEGNFDSYDSDNVRVRDHTIVIPVKGYFTASGCNGIMRKEKD